MSRWLYLAGGLGIAGLAGCSSPPPPPPPTVVNLTIQATPDVNPGAGGNGNPVGVRVYQLTSPDNFNAAEFFPLFNSDAATLKSDIIQRDAFLLRPGETKTETLRPKDPAKSLGIFAAYRDFGHATWRAATDIAPNKTTDVMVTVGRDGLTIKAQVQPPAKPAS